MSRRTHESRTVEAMLVVVFLLLALYFLFPPQLKAEPHASYPDVACYAGNKGYGWPLLLENKPGAPLNVDLITSLARYSTITLNVGPWYALDEPSRADAILLLRKLNPRIRIVAYQLLTWWYLSPDFVPHASDKTWAASWHRAIRATNGFGAQSGGGWWVKWEQPATEAALTKLLCGMASSRLFDGFFADYMWGPVKLTPQMERLTQALRDAGGPAFLVLGNGTEADAANTDGGFREGFPDYLGHDFEHIRKWRAGRPHRSEDWLQAGTGYSELTSAASQRAARFAHGTACLFDLQCSFGPDRDLGPQPFYHTWWLPEYDGGGIGAGWLGQPMAPPEQFVGLTLWRRLFDGGLVLVNTGSGPLNAPVTPGHRRIANGSEMGTITVPARDAVFLVRMR